METDAGRRQLREHNHTPEQVGTTASQVSDTTFKRMGIISSNPSTRIRKIKAIRALGATAVVLMNISGADPQGTLRVYGNEILPVLRD